MQLPPLDKGLLAKMGIAPDAVPIIPAPADTFGINIKNPQPQPQKALTSDECIKLFGAREAVLMNFIPQMLTALALEQADATATSPYKDWSTINRVWAPQIFWDPDYCWENGEKGGYMIYYSMLNRAEEKYDRMYYSYADKTFTKLTTPKLLFDWGYATIDADINFLKSDGLYHMLIKKEGGKRGIFTATSKYLNHGWSAPVDDDFVSFEGSKLTEGSSAFQLIGDDTWRVAYIQYSDHPKHYRICKADKYLRNFSDPVDIKGVTAPQHGSFMRITKKEYKMLLKWNQELKNIEK